MKMLAQYRITPSKRNILRVHQCPPTKRHRNEGPDMGRITYNLARIRDC